MFKIAKEGVLIDISLSRIFSKSNEVNVSFTYEGNYKYNFCIRW